MKDFDNSFITAITSEEAITFWLVVLGTSTDTYQYFTDLDIDIVIDGDRYLSIPIAIAPVNYSVGMSVNKMRVEFENVSLEMSATLLNNTITGQPAIIYGGVMVSDLPVVEVLFRGLSSDWSLNEKKAEITIVDEFVYWNKRSLRKPDVLCPWEFKGTECGYSGSVGSCNKTYYRCNGLSNSDSFGGFRFFPAMEEKEVWWGKNGETTPPPVNTSPPSFNPVTWSH